MFKLFSLIFKTFSDLTISVYPTFSPPTPSYWFMATPSFYCPLGFYVTVP